MVDAGDEIWRFQVGSTDGDDVVNGVSASEDGSFFLAGFTEGSFDGDIENDGFKDMVVAKLDSDGLLLWSWQDGTESSDMLLSAAATDDGGVVVGGSTLGDYNGVDNQGSRDFVAIKLNSVGAVEWRWQEGTEGDEEIEACSTTADGNVVLAGFTNGDWESVGSGEAEVMAVKLDVADGTVLWRYQAGASNASVIGWGAAARADGSIVLAGSTEGDWNEELVGTRDFMAVALDVDGEELWRWQDGVKGNDSIITGISVLWDKSIVLVGHTEGDYANENQGGRDFVVVKLTADGDLDWNLQDGTQYNDFFRGAATGIDGTSAIIAGYTYGTWADTNNDEGDYSDFVGMSLDGNGSILWTYQSGTTQGNDLYGVAVRPDGAALLAGSTDGEFSETANATVYNDFAGVLIATGSISVAVNSSSSSSTSSDSAPLEPIIGGSLAGVVVLLISVILLLKRRAKKGKGVADYPTLAAAVSSDAAGGGVAYPTMIPEADNGSTSSPSSPPAYSSNQTHSV